MTDRSTDVTPTQYRRNTDVIPTPRSEGLLLANTSETARAEQLLAEHRDSIDRLDAILVYTLAERFKQTQAVGRLKAEHDLPPADKAREAKQIERLEWLSKEADLDPEFAKKFLKFIIQEVIQHHKQHQK